MDNHPSGSERLASAETCEGIRRHLEHGAPWDACDAFREAVEQHASDAEILYWGALAHARAGAVGEAHALLNRAQAASDAPARIADILSLRGRLWKDGVHRALEASGAAGTTDATGPSGATEMMERARREYLAAYAVARDPFPGINAATLSLLLGERAAAQALAQEILARLAALPTPRTMWDEATAGEAQLLLGRFVEARQSYAEAYAHAADNAGNVATMRRQLSLLSHAIPEAAAVLRLLPAPDVIAFAGHMIDAPDRGVPRFPATLVPVVAGAVRERLAATHQPIVYTSAACGADLVFIEAALDAGAEVNVVLPFKRGDFARESVAVGGDCWVERFDHALARATRVIMATEEDYLGDDVLFEHAATLLEGLAILRAARLQTSPSMLCVLDPSTLGKVGGTRSSFERWTRTIGPPDVIDLRELRLRAGLDKPPPLGTAGSPTRAPPAPASAAASVAQRTLKTLLFVDCAGYSRMQDAVIPRFQHRFWTLATEQVEASRVKPLLANTWGDALFVVFDLPRDGADFALGLVERMRAVDWAAAGLPAPGQIRVALHAGPVFDALDPILERRNFFGSTVVRTARIEPVTPPDTIYASETFAALLAAAGTHAYALEYIGRQTLAKGYGETRIYRLDRR